MWEIFERLRLERGVSAYEVAKACGFRAGVISSWKMGRYTPKADKLQKIADYFGVTVEYLMTGEVKDGYYINPETAKVAQELFENNDLRVLFDAARDASPEDLKAVYAMLLALKRKEQGRNDEPC